MDKNYDVISFFQSTFIIRRLRVVNFADIIKTATIVIKKPLGTQKKIKRIRNYGLKCNLYLIS